MILQEGARYLYYIPYQKDAHNDSCEHVFYVNKFDIHMREFYQNSRLVTCCQETLPEHRISFYENDFSSEIVRGHNDIMKYLMIQELEK